MHLGVPGRVNKIRGTNWLLATGEMVITLEMTWAATISKVGKKSYALEKG